MGLILKRNFCFDVNGRFESTWMVILYFPSFLSVSPECPLGSYGSSWGRRTPSPFASSRGACYRCTPSGIRDARRTVDYLFPWIWGKSRQIFLIKSYIMTFVLCSPNMCTLWIRRMEHRKYNRGRSRLPKLGQTIVPSVLFPLFHPPYPQGTAFITRAEHNPWVRQFFSCCDVDLRTHEEGASKQTIHNSRIMFTSLYNSPNEIRIGYPDVLNRVPVK